VFAPRSCRLREPARIDFVGGMNNNPTEARQEKESGSENIQQRLQTLAQKTAALNETLARVEKNLKEARSEASSPGRVD
jgi:septal ring factor EnvC (AmiA/AmiB activator)